MYLIGRRDLSKTQGNTSQWYRFTCYPLSNENAVSIPNQKDEEEREREKYVRKEHIE
jgi:hypothetical protein